MLPEPEMINHMHQAIIPLIILLERLHQLLQQPYFHIGVVDVEFFVLANLGGHHSLVGVLIIYALDDLAKGALVNGSHHLVAVADLLALFYEVLPILIGDGILVLAAHLPDCVDALVHADLNLLELGQLILEYLQGVLGAVAHLLAVLPKILWIER